MDTLEERATQYHDGLISSREFLGFVIEIVGKVWEQCSDENETEECAKLANKLAHWISA